MLIEFSGRNCGCFREDFRLSLLAADIDPGSDRGIVKVPIEGEEPLRLLRAIALYGPNASGKSTLLRAAGAMSELIGTTQGLTSDAPLTQYEPFLLGPQRDQPSTLAAKAVIDGRVYDYSISFHRAAVTAERLVRWGSDESPETLLDRNDQGVAGSWTTDPQFQLLTTEFRPNALLLSLADSIAPNLAKGIAVSLRSLLHHADTLPHDPLVSSVRVARRVREDPAFNDWLLSTLKAADIGVVDIQIERFRAMHWVREPSSGLEALVGDVGSFSPRLRPTRGLGLVHHAVDGPASLPYAKESLGTQRLVAWAPLLYDLAHSKEPKAAFIDELDASMHPLLLRSIVEHFNCEIPPDKVHGQLIFTTHETSLIDDEAREAVLRRDQVYFTEKDAHGAARLFSIAEFRERNNLNLRRRYLQGRYGALPAIGTLTE